MTYQPSPGTITTTGARPKSPPCRHCGHEAHKGGYCRASLPQSILPMRCPCATWADGTADPMALKRLRELTGGQE